MNRSSAGTPVSRLVPRFSGGITAVVAAWSAAFAVAAISPSTVSEPVGVPATTEATKNDTATDAAARDDDALAAAICEAVINVENFSGVVLVARGDNILATRTAGQSNRERNVATTLDTLYDLASVSKPMTAAAVLRLVDRGLLDLDDTLAHALRASPGAVSAMDTSAESNDDEVWADGEETPFIDDGTEPPGVGLAQTTIRDLLRHRSGIAQNFPGGPPDMTTDRHGMLRGVAGFSTIAGTIEGNELGVGGGRPGQFLYNNTNYCVLAAVVEELAKRSFQAEMRASVFEPASMHDVWFVGERRVPRDRGCYRYSSARGMRGASFVADHPHGWLHRGATGVVASAPDVFRFARAIRAGGLLSQRTTEEMFRVEPGETYALGWVVARPAPGARVVHHVGQTRGCESLLAVVAPVWDDPSKDLTVVILTNMQGVVNPAWSAARREIAASHGWKPRFGHDND